MTAARAARITYRRQHPDKPDLTLAGSFSRHLLHSVRRTSPYLLVLDDRRRALRRQGRLLDRRHARHGPKRLRPHARGIVSASSGQHRRRAVRDLLALVDHATLRGGGPPKYGSIRRIEHDQAAGRALRSSRFATSCHAADRHAAGERRADRSRPPCGRPRAFAAPHVTAGRG
jgi:hypothetical protein